MKKRLRLLLKDFFALFLPIEYLSFKSPLTGNYNKKGTSVLLLFFTFALGILGQSLTAQTIKTIGTGGNYPTVKAAFDAVNSGSITGNITLQLVSNTAETNFSKLNASGNGNANYSSVTFYPTTSGLTVTGNLGSSLIEFAGCKNVTIDGRVNQTGNADLTLSNTGTAVSSSKTIYYHDGATDNVIRYCNIKGSNTGSSGAIISFETSTDVTGNNNNTIEYCTITNSGSRPTVAILSSGTSGNENKGNVIANNNFYDFFSASIYSSYGIHISSNSTDWTVTGNSFYETTTFSPAENNYYYAIRISTGNNHSIANNYIGGKSPQSGGSSWNMSLSATSSSTFFGIFLAVGATTTSSVQNNVIKNINLTSAATNTSPFCGIYVGSGKVTIGTTSGNTIGSSTGTGSITVTNTNLSTNPTIGISINGSDNVSVENNTIGSFTLLGSTAINHNFRGIASNGTGVISIKNNSIGSTSTANSILVSSSAITSANPQYLYGISNDGNGTLTISNNTIANLNNAYGGTLTSSQTVGINISNGTRGTNTIENNSIRNLSNASPQTNSIATASVVGISQRSTVSNQTITKNKIYNLYNTFTGSAAVGVFGIFYTGGTTGTNTVSKNFIQNLSSSSSSTAAVIAGIRIDTGVTTYSNNIISLGTGISTGYVIYGIYEPGTANNNCNLYFNTVYIGGTPAGGSTTYALFNNANSNTRDLRNNIFFNARTNASGTAKHYAIRLAGNTNLTINYNNYFANGSGGVLGLYSTDKTDLTSWRTSTSQDVNSVSATPGLSSAGGTNELDYKPNEGSFFAAANGIGITTDYSDYSRQLTPSIGAYEQRLFVDGSISFCAGSNNASFSLIGSNLTVTKWQSSPDAITWTDTANTSTTYNATNITSTTYYRAVVQWNTNSTANSSIASLTVSSISIGGSVTGNATVCSGTNNTLFTLSGYTGTILKWQSSINGTVWSDIANTSTGYTAINVNSTTFYRAVIQSGVCSVAYSSAASVTVSPTSVGGTLSGGRTLCSSTNSTLLTLNGNTGAVVKWQSSLYGTSWSDIANTNTTYTVTNQNNTMYYRVVVQNGSCSTANSSSTAISVIPSFGGTLSGAATVCSGTNSTTLTLSSEIGTISKWQSSVNNIDWTDVENPNSIYAATNLLVTTYFRVVVQNGVCSSTNSSSITITVNPKSVGGSVSSGTAICSGSTSGLLTLSGKTGNVVRWESAISPFTVWTTITNTANTYTSGPLTQATQFRAVVQNGICSSANSSTALITVSPTSVGGSVSGGAAICYGSTSGLLTLVGNTGNVVRWESAISPFTVWTTINNTVNTYTSGAVTETTQFRAVVQSGSCALSYSSYATIAIASTTYNGTSWSNGSPTITTNAIFTGNFTSTAHINACTLTVINNAAVTIVSENNVTLNGALIVDSGSSFTLQNNANLVQTSNVNNSGTILISRNTNLLMRLDYALWSSPVKQQNLLAFSPATLVNRFYLYNPDTNLYNSIVPSTTNFVEGTAYLVRLPNTHPITPTLWTGTFLGIPNNGDVNVSVTNGTYNAIGNPYPSTIDADAFITTNGITEALYFWRKTNNTANTSYATYTLAGGTGTAANTGDPHGLVPNGSIQVGQGFIAKATSTALSFTNSMRIADNQNQFLRSVNSERNRIWLNLTTTDGLFSQTMLAYMSGATLGIDPAIDGRYYNDSQVALTSIIENQEFAIQGRPLPFDSSDVVPLGFKATASGNYTISLANTDGIFSESSRLIFLKDNLLQTTFDLRSGNYNFTSEAGIFNSRFEIIYQTLLAVNNPILVTDQVVVYKKQEHLVINSGNIEMTKIHIFDIRGRLLVQKENFKTHEIEINVGNTKQLLIVKITTSDNRTIVKKVIN